MLSKKGIPTTAFDVRKELNSSTEPFLPPTTDSTMYRKALLP